jgi:hypothetical protein
METIRKIKSLQRIFFFGTASILLLANFYAGHSYWKTSIMCALYFTIMLHIKERKIKPIFECIKLKAESGKYYSVFELRYMIGYYATFYEICYMVGYYHNSIGRSRRSDGRNMKKIPTYKFK